MILPILLALVAGWINRHQQHVITYLKEENRVLTSKLPRGRLHLNDTEHRRLAKLARPSSRKQMRDTATIATPDTLMRWDNRLLATTFDGSKQRNGPGRPCVDEEIEHRVMRVAEDNPTWGSATCRVPWLISGIPSTRSPFATYCVAITLTLLPNDARQA
jgi:hypothetical protein